MLVLAMMVGCTDKGDCDTAGVTASSVTDDCFYPGFDIEGNGYDFLSEATVSAPDNLCASLVDPTPVVDETGPLTYLQSSVPVGDDGTFAFRLVTTTSIIGLVMITDDCDDSTDNWAALGTGIPSDTVGEMDYGDLIEGQQAYVMSNADLAVIEADLATAGYSGGNGLATDGYVMGVVIDGEDPSTASTVGGATVFSTKDDTLSVFYGDNDLSDGRFTTAGKPNTATDASTNVGFFIPAGIVSSYTADDGANEYYEILGGSTEGIGMFIRVPRVSE